MLNFRKKKLDQVAAYQALFSSEDGKKVLYDLIKTHHIISPTFSKNELEFALKEGERNVVLRILQIIKVNPQKLLEDINKGIEQDNLYID